MHRTIYRERIIAPRFSFRRLRTPRAVSNPPVPPKTSSLRRNIRARSEHQRVSRNVLDGVFITPLFLLRRYPKAQFPSAADDFPRANKRTAFTRAAHVPAIPRSRSLTPRSTQAGVSRGAKMRNRDRRRVLSCSAPFIKADLENFAVKPSARASQHFAKTLGGWPYSIGRLERSSRI